MMCISVAILLAGMLAGIAMGVQQDFTLAPAHAHLNLVGGVLLILFGLYRLVPAAGNSPLAKVQGWLYIAGAILFPAGVAGIVLKGTFIAAPVVGSLDCGCLRPERSPRLQARSLFKLIRGIVRGSDSPRHDARNT